MGRIYSCGYEKDPQVGETKTSLLYLQFFSDDSGTGRGFNLTYAVNKGKVLFIGYVMFLTT